MFTKDFPHSVNLSIALETFLLKVSIWCVCAYLQCQRAEGLTGLQPPRLSLSNNQGKAAKPQGLCSSKHNLCSGIQKMCVYTAAV